MASGYSWRAEGGPLEGVVELRITEAAARGTVRDVGDGTPAELLCTRQADRPLHEGRQLARWWQRHPAGPPLPSFATTPATRVTRGVRVGVRVTDWMAGRLLPQRVGESFPGASFSCCWGREGKI